MAKMKTKRLTKKEKAAAFAREVKRNIKKGEAVALARDAAAWRQYQDHIRTRPQTAAPPSITERLRPIIDRVFSVFPIFEPFLGGARCVIVIPDGPVITGSAFTLSMPGDVCIEALNRRAHGVAIHNALSHFLDDGLNAKSDGQIARGASAGVDIGSAKDFRSNRNEV